MGRGFAARALFLAAGPWAHLCAQSTRTTERATVAPSGRQTVACSGQRIDDIVVYSAAPSVANLERVPWLARIARSFHTTTRPDVVRGFMLLDVGDGCVELRRAESERILRAQPFLADADIYVVPDTSGGVDLEVRTSDEASIVFGGSVRAKTPQVSGLLLGNANLGGRGVFLDGGWHYGDGFRGDFTGRLVDYQLLGQPMVGMLEVDRASRGGTWRSEVLHPFYTDLQRVAWHVLGGSVDQYIEVRRPDDLRPSVFLNRDYGDVGGLVRIGAPGRLTLLGASLTGEDEFSGDRLTTGDTGIVRDVGPVPGGQYVAHRVIRANLLYGVRDVHFERHDGLDALTGPQDVPIGFQIGGLVGHTVRALGSRDDDTFISADGYAGGSSGIGVLRVQARGEARRISGSGVWDGILTSARATHSLQYSSTHVNQVRLEWSAVFRQRTPFQLLSGVPEAGVRGFEKSDWAGGQRLVAHIEERYLVGKPYNLADAGVAVFADAGRMWAGDVPFGRTSPVLGSLGISLLVAAPPRSGRTFRADLAFPIGPGANARWTLTFTNLDRSRFVFREPVDVTENREPTVPTSIFSWP